METRILGKTGREVSRLGLGLAALGRPGYINLGHADDLRHDYDREAMLGRACAVLNAARAGGIRYFDAARSYGDAEAFLGEWLSAAGVVPGAVTVGSKWGYTYTAGWKVQADRHEVKDHTLPVLKRQVGESLARLNGYIGLYQIHSVTLESGVLDDGAVLAELVRLRREHGWAIGLSLSGPAQADTLRAAMTKSVEGERVFDCVQATWNLLERSAGDALSEAHAAGLGVIVKEALANGRLTERNADPDFGAKKEVLDRTAAQLGAPLDALALAAVLARPWADVVLSGAATTEQVRSNLLALTIPWDEEVERVLLPLGEPPETYWRTRSGLSWN